MSSWPYAGLSPERVLEEAAKLELLADEGDSQAGELKRIIEDLVDQAADVRAKAAEMRAHVAEALAEEAGELDDEPEEDGPAGEPEGEPVLVTTSPGTSLERRFWRYPDGLEVDELGR